MEKEPQHYITDVNNYDLYLAFTPNLLEIIVMSTLTNSIYNLKITNASMQPDCKMIFQNVTNLFQYFKEQAGRENGLIVLDDAGVIKVFEEFQKNGRKIRMEVALNTNKIVKEEEKNDVLVQIVNLMKKQMRKNKKELNKSMNQIEAQSNEEASLVKEQTKQFKKQYLSFDGDVNTKQKKLFPVYLSKEGKANCIQVSKYGNQQGQIICFPGIPYEGRKQITINIVKSKNYQLQFGIMIYNMWMEMSAIFIDLGTGLIQNKVVRKFSDKKMESSVWPAIKKLKKHALKMQIDTEQKQITWFCNNAIIAQTAITFQFLLAGSYFRPLICMKNVGDSILLNQQQCLLGI